VEIGDVAFSHWAGAIAHLGADDLGGGLTAVFGVATVGSCLKTSVQKSYTYFFSQSITNVLWAGAIGDVGVEDLGGA